jgi:large subunit ribosomal protein L9
MPRLPAGAFRQTGEYDVDLHLHSDVNITVKLVIVAE